MVAFVITTIAKIYARQIYRGNKTIEDVVPTSFQDTVREAYYEIYGEECPEVEDDTEDEDTTEE